MNNFSIELKLRKARRVADELIQKYGITEPGHIQLKDIAYCLKIDVIETNLKNASASLTRLGDRGIIRVSSSINSVGRKRFCIGHEVGHFCLGHKIHINKICNNDDMNEWYLPSIEHEANEFASELLLPSTIIEPKCNIAIPAFDHIKKLSEEFRCSLTATAIKFVEHCKEPCAIVYSENGKIVWSKKGKDFYPYIERDRPLPKNTFAYDYFYGLEQDIQYDKMQEVDSAAWVSQPSLSMFEQTTQIYDNSTLSLLWLKN
jgi:Zn-dependent peptidase ImmA (M78 family)